MKAFPRGCLISLFFLLTVTSLLLAQPISFKTVPLPEDANQIAIIDSTQRSQGVMWFATHPGLYRYHGYRWAGFLNDPRNPHSLADKRVECLYADHDGSTWVGSFTGGLDRFDPQTSLFMNFHQN